MADPFERTFLTVPEVAGILRLHQITVYRMLKKKELPSFRVGGRWRIPSDVIDRLLKGEINADRNRQTRNC